MDVVSLLESRNRCLRRFLDATEEFRVLACRGDFEGLDAFEARREIVLRALDLYDRQLELVIGAIAETARTPALIDSVKRRMNERDVIIHRILEVDQDIIRLIEDHQEKLLGAMALSRKSREQISKFKSTWIAQSGEELDSKV